METYIARRAEIVDSPPNPDKVADSGTSQYHVVNTQSGLIVGKANSLSAARRILDRKDNEYGGYAHKIVYPRPITPTPAG